MRKKLAFDVELSNRKYRLRLARYRYLADALGKELPAGENLVLDVGCGKGRLPRYWKRWSPPGKEARFIGVDVHPRRLRHSRTRGYAVLLKSDIRRSWPFPDQSFTAVVCEQILEHFTREEIHAVLSEAYRVLKPGGVAFIGTPVFKRIELWLSPVWLRFDAVRRVLMGREPAAHLQHFSLEQVKALVAEHGFVPERIRGFRLFSLFFDALEDYEWYYRLHQWCGTHSPGLCVEASILARRAVDAAGAQAARSPARECELAL